MLCWMQLQSMRYHAKTDAIRSVHLENKLENLHDDDGSWLKSKITAIRTPVIIHIRVRTANIREQVWRRNGWTCIKMQYGKCEYKSSRRSLVLFRVCFCHANMRCHFMRTSIVLLFFVLRTIVLWKLSNAERMNGEAFVHGKWWKSIRTGHYRFSSWARMKTEQCHFLPAEGMSAQCIRAYSIQRGEVSVYSWPTTKTERAFFGSYERSFSFYWFLTGLRRLNLLLLIAMVKEYFRHFWSVQEESWAQDRCVQHWIGHGYRYWYLCIDVWYQRLIEHLPQSVLRAWYYYSERYG